jgi:hypothetical protein
VSDFWCTHIWKIQSSDDTTNVRQHRVIVGGLQEITLWKVRCLAKLPQHSAACRRLRHRCRRTSPPDANSTSMLFVDAFFARFNCNLLHFFVLKLCF